MLRPHSDSLEFPGVSSSDAGTYQVNSRESNHQDTGKPSLSQTSTFLQTLLDLLLQCVADNGFGHPALDSVTLRVKRKYCKKYKGSFTLLSFGQSSI